MTSEQQRILELESKIQTLEEQLASRDSLIAQLVEQLASLKNQKAQDSHNSSKPPSSDSFVRSSKKRSLRKVSGKKPGGQAGHLGQALRQVAEPDQVINHLAPTCRHCQTSLEAVAPATQFEARQVFELPTARLVVSEHRVYTRCCPACQKPNRGEFPQTVRQWVQYGPAFRALAVYLVEYQLLPYERACQLLNEIYGVGLSPGSLVLMVGECAEQLAPTEQSIKQGLLASPVLHFDESSLRIKGQRQWFHVVSSPSLTHYAYHPKRGKQAFKQIGILPQYTGTAIHDGYASYCDFPCEHGLCNAHHLRELTWVEEQLQQPWATDFKQLLLDLKAAVEVARNQNRKALDPARLTECEQSYQQLIEAGLAANPPPEGGWPRGKRGRPRQSKAKNLLDRLDKQRRRVLLFAYRFEVPFDNNQAERDIRMVKVQQKISGGFRSSEGAGYFCRIRGYLSTLQKQGQNLLAALRQVFEGHPLLPPSLA
jgi:transposase